MRERHLDPERSRSSGVPAAAAVTPLAAHRTDMGAATHSALSGSALAFDFGLKRIGVAVTDVGLGIAHPLAAIACEDNRRRFEAIAALISEWQPICLVVGCPGLNANTARPDADPSPAVHPLSVPIRRFARRLHERYRLPVELVDEDLSSWEASRKLTHAGVPAHAQKTRLDSMAACTILETWLATPGAQVAGGKQGR